MNRLDQSNPFQAPQHEFTLSQKAIPFSVTWLGTFASGAIVSLFFTLVLSMLWSAGFMFNQGRPNFVWYAQMVAFNLKVGGSVLWPFGMLWTVPYIRLCHWKGIILLGRPLNHGIAFGTGMVLILFGYIFIERESFSPSLGLLTAATLISALIGMFCGLVGFYSLQFFNRERKKQPATAPGAALAED